MKSKNYYIIPTFFLFIGLIISLVGYKTDKKNFKDQIQKSLENHGKNYKDKIEHQLAISQKSIERMARRWEANKGTDNKIWTIDAQAYIKDLPYIQAIEWVNSSNIVKWIVPLNGNEAALNYDLGSNPRRLDAIELSKRNKKIYSTKIVKLKQNGDGFLSFFPLYYSLKHQGFLLVVYKVKDLLKSVINGNLLNYELYEDQVNIYSNYSSMNKKDKDKYKDLEVVKKINFSNISWTIKFHPNAKFIEKLNNSFSYTTFYIDLSISLILFLFSILITSVIKKEHQLGDANAKILSQKLALDSSAIVAETDLKGKITYVNDKFIEISKYSRDELMGQDHRLLNSGHHVKSYFENIWQTINQGLLWNGEIKNKDKNGNYYWVDTSIYPVKNKYGQLEKFVAIRFDITKRKNIEDEIKNSIKIAEDALQTKTRFLATMGHELRTPMSGILSCTDLLSQNIKDKENIKLTNTIKICGDSLLTIIDDILDFSKIEAGKIVLDTRSYHFEDSIKEIIYFLQQSANTKKILIEYTIAKSVPTYVNIDITRYRQVMINLIGNALKFTKNTIKVSISTKRKSDQEIELITSVEDNGIGIPKASIKKLFQSFSQVDASTTRKFGGTGLGLAICKGLVNTMGGEINATSELNKGSIFTFTISSQKSNKSTSSLNNKQSNQDTYTPTKNKLKILMAEDNQINQMIGRQILLRLGQDVDIANNGYEVIEKVENKTYDLIIMDQHMPEMDGIDATKKICSRWAKKDRPKIIALTASALEEDRKRCLDSGMDYFLTKPLNVSELKQIIDQCENKILLNNSTETNNKKDAA